MTLRPPAQTLLALVSTNKQTADLQAKKPPTPDTPKTHILVPAEFIMISCSFPSPRVGEGIVHCIPPPWGSCAPLLCSCALRSVLVGLRLVDQVVDRQPKPGGYDGELRGLCLVFVAVFVCPHFSQVLYGYAHLLAVFLHCFGFILCRQAVVQLLYSIFILCEIQFAYIST